MEAYPFSAAENQETHLFLGAVAVAAMSVLLPQEVVSALADRDVYKETVTLWHFLAAAEVSHLAFVPPDPCRHTLGRRHIQIPDLRTVAAARQPAETVQHIAAASVQYRPLSRQCICELPPDLARVVSILALHQHLPDYFLGAYFCILRIEAMTLMGSLLE